MKAYSISFVGLDCKDEHVRKANSYKLYIIILHFKLVGAITVISTTVSKAVNNFRAIFKRQCIKEGYVRLEKGNGIGTFLLSLQHMWIDCLPNRLEKQQGM